MCCWGGASLLEVDLGWDLKNGILDSPRGLFPSLFLLPDWHVVDSFPLQGRCHAIPTLEPTVVDRILLNRESKWNSALWVLGVGGFVAVMGKWLTQWATVRSSTTILQVSILPELENHLTRVRGGRFENLKCYCLNYLIIISSKLEV